MEATKDEGRIYNLINQLLRDVEEVMRPLDVPEGFEIVLDRSGIKDFLPHNYLKLALRDIVRSKQDGTFWARAMYPENHPNFSGHFPGMPVLPAADILEGAEQAGALLWLIALGSSKTEVKVKALASGIEEIRNGHYVGPNQVIWYRISHLIERTEDGKRATWARDKVGRLEGVVAVHLDPDGGLITRCRMGGFFNWVTSSSEVQLETAAA